MNNVSIVPDALDYFDKYNEYYENYLKNVRYIEINYSNIDTSHSVIILYDSKKKELFRSRYETIGLHDETEQVWIWSWAIPTSRKTTTIISRKILNYGVDMNTNDLVLKTELITSRFKISNPIQIDIHLAISAYLSKQKLIFKYSITNEIDVDEDNIIDIVPKNDKNKKSYYLFLLDHEKLKF